MTPGDARKWVPQWEMSAEVPTCLSLEVGVRPSPFIEGNRAPLSVTTPIKRFLSFVRTNGNRIVYWGPLDWAFPLFHAPPRMMAMVSRSRNPCRQNRDDHSRSRY